LVDDIVNFSWPPAKVTKAKRWISLLPQNRARTELCGIKADAFALAVIDSAGLITTYPVKRAAHTTRASISSCIFDGPKCRRAIDLFATDIRDLLQTICQP
jgi:hypothetical protein